MSQNERIFRRTGEPWIDLGIIAVWDAAFAGGIQDYENDHWIAENGSLKGILTQEEACIYGNRDPYDQCVQSVSTKVLDVASVSSTGKTHPFRSIIGEMLLRHVNQGLAFPTNILSPRQFKTRTKKSGTCTFCSEPRPIRDAGATHLPLLVDPDKMLNVYSELSPRTSHSICRECTLAGLASISKAFYLGSKPNRNTYRCVLILPEAANLVSLNSFLRSTMGIRQSGATEFWRNFGEGAFQTEDVDEPTSTYMAFLLNIWIFVRNQAGLNLSEMGLTDLVFHVIAIEKIGNTASMRDYMLVPAPATQMQLIQRCDRVNQKGETWNALATVMGNLRLRQPGQQEGSVRLREEAARAIVARRDVTSPIAEFLYEWDSRTEARQPLNTYAIEEFVSQYEKEVIGLTEDDLRRVKAVGDAVGELIFKKKDKGLLYRLRNARNDVDILEALQHMLSRYADDFKATWDEESVASPKGDEEKVYLNRRRLQELAEAVNPDNWQRIKALLGIYAMLRYLENRQREQQRQSAQTQS